MLLSAAPSGTPSEGEWNCHEGELAYRAVEGTYTNARTDRDVLLLLVRLRDLEGEEAAEHVVALAANDPRKRPDGPAFEEGTRAGDSLCEGNRASNEGGEDCCGEWVVGEVVCDDHSHLH